MELAGKDRSALAGERGEACRIAMELVVKVGEAQGATDLIDIEAAHIDGCLFHGQAGLDFAQRLAADGTQVAVPTTLNVSSLDLLHPELFRGEAETASAARSLMDAYVSLGCVPSWTCAPYQLADRPSFGQQIAWGESNAIVFANSVLGARTERYGDFMDIACAITGRAPNVGLHTDEGRSADIVVDVQVDSTVLDGELAYPLLGHVLGQLAGTGVPVVVGLDARADEDRLKSLGAAAASSGAVAMFHAVGVTPEAPTLDTALQGRAPRRRFQVRAEDLLRGQAELSTGSGRLGAVSVGTPHMSETELRRLASLTAGMTSRVPFYVSTSRDVLAVTSGIEEAMESFGATLVTDTCTYITPIMGSVEGQVMTNSGKWAYYAPANLGVGVILGSLADCVASATAGDVVRTGEWS